MKNHPISLTTRIILPLFLALSIGSQLCADRGLNVPKPGGVTYVCDGTTGSMHFPVAPTSMGTTVTVSFNGRSDASATTVICNLRLNGDSGANYAFASGAVNPPPTPTPGGTPIPTPTPPPPQTGIQLCFVPGATAPAGFSTTASARIVGFGLADAGFYKTVEVKNLDNISGADWCYYWMKTTESVTDISLTLASGNFSKGSTITVTWE
jgi:hypothetical protein